MKYLTQKIVSLFSGFILGAFFIAFFITIFSDNLFNIPSEPTSENNHNITNLIDKKEPEILYWVAPMDPNYQRDKPGLSPMGMELIPVYAEENTLKPESTLELGSTPEPEILYWVAPMDPNYQRDKPGLSPMGMELIPVYAEENTGKSSQSTKGLLLLTPEVINNINVKIESVQFMPWQQTLESFGRFEYNEEEIHHLHSRVSGWIEKLYVKAQGEKVIKGQALYSFYSPELINAQEELLQSLNANDKRMTRAAKDKLAALGVPLPTIKSVVNTRKAQKNITYYAKLDGAVKSLEVRPGFYIKPESNIISIAPLHTIWLIAEVFESQLSQIAENDHVNITAEAYPNTLINGKIDYIYPSLELPSRMAKVRIRVDNSKLTLKPNMFARVFFTKVDNKNTVIVPLNSVIRTGKSDRVVLVQEKGKFQSIAVTLGRSNSQVIEILSGLSQGDKIISSGQFLIDSQSNIGRDLDRMNANTNNNTLKGHHD